MLDFVGLSETINDSMHNATIDRLVVAPIPGSNNTAWESNR